MSFSVVVMWAQAAPGYCVVIVGNVEQLLDRPVVFLACL